MAALAEQVDKACQCSVRACSIADVAEGKLEHVDAVLNTTPLGMVGDREQETPLPQEFLAKVCITLPDPTCLVSDIPICPAGCNSMTLHTICPSILGFTHQLCCVQSKPLVFDAVYTPLETRLLREAKAAGCATVDGLEMFVGQAAAQFKFFTGLNAPVDLMRKTVLQSLQT